MKMWRTKIGLAIAATAMAMAAFGFQGLPHCTSIEPDSGKVGDTVTAKGEHLEKSNVAQVYLTDGQKDTPVTVSDQSDTEIKFKVPEMKAGRYHLLILTGNRASLIEQPVVFTVQ